MSKQTVMFHLSHLSPVTPYDLDLCYSHSLQHNGHSVHRHCLSDSTIEQCSPELNVKNGCRVGLNTTKFD